MNQFPSQEKRTRTLGFAAAAAILLLTFVSQSASAQKAAPDAMPNATLISLGNVEGLPKSQVLIPVLLTPFPQELKIGEFKASIGFDSQWVTYLRAEKGFLLDGEGGVFQTDVQTDVGKPGHSVIHLTVTTKGTPRQAIREGLVVTLAFRILESAPAATIVDVALSDLNASDLSDPPKSIRPLTGKNGSITVLAPEQNPYVPCFFFTH